MSEQNLGLSPIGIVGGHMKRLCLSCQKKPARPGPYTADTFCSLRCAASRGVDETEIYEWCAKHGWTDNPPCYKCTQEKAL